MQLHTLISYLLLSVYNNPLCIVSPLHTCFQITCINVIHTSFVAPRIGGTTAFTLLLRVKLLSFAIENG